MNYLRIRNRNKPPGLKWLPIMVLEQVTVELGEARACHYERGRMWGVKAFQYQTSLQMSPFFTYLPQLLALIVCFEWWVLSILKKRKKEKVEMSTCMQVHHTAPALSPSYFLRGGDSGRNFISGLQELPGSTSASLARWYVVEISNGFVVCRLGFEH